MTKCECNSSNVSHKYILLKIRASRYQQHDIYFRQGLSSASVSFAPLSPDSTYVTLQWALINHISAMQHLQKMVKQPIQPYCLKMSSIFLVSRQLRVSYFSPEKNKTQKFVKLLIIRHHINRFSVSYISVTLTFTQKNYLQLQDKTFLSISSIVYCCKIRFINVIRLLHSATFKFNFEVIQYQCTLYGI